MGEDRLYLGLITLDLVIHGCSSLKDKRRIVKGLTDRLESGSMYRCANTPSPIAPEGQDRRRLRRF